MTVFSVCGYLSHRIHSSIYLMLQILNPQKRQDFSLLKHSQYNLQKATEFQFPASGNRHQGNRKFTAGGYGGSKKEPPQPVFPQASYVHNSMAVCLFKVLQSLLKSLTDQSCSLLNRFNIHTNRPRNDYYREREEEVDKKQLQTNVPKKPM